MKYLCRSSVAKHLRCGEVINDHFIACLLLNFVSERILKIRQYFVVTKPDGLTFGPPISIF